MSVATSMAVSGNTLQQRNRLADPIPTCTPDLAPPPHNITYPPRITLRVEPQYPFYLATAPTISVLISIPVDNDNKGKVPFKNETYDPSSPNPGEKIPLTRMRVRVSSSQGELLSNWQWMPVNGSNKAVLTFPLRLTQIPGEEGVPVMVNVMAISPDAIQSLYETCTIMVFPDPNLEASTGLSLESTQSQTRIDQLYGGIQIRSELTELQWRDFLPVGWLVEWAWLKKLLDFPNSEREKVLEENFTTKGFNAIQVILPTVLKDTDFVVLEKLFGICDEIGLHVVLDLRNIYQSEEMLQSVVGSVVTHPSLLSYSTSWGADSNRVDQPQGETYNATLRIKEIDMLRPVAITVECVTLSLEDYTRSADIVVEKVWPALPENTALSTTNDTGHIRNLYAPISAQIESLDLLHANEWQSNRFRKPVWSVPQASLPSAENYAGQGADLTGKDVIISSLLRLNYGAMGVISYIYPPPTDEIEEAMTGLATTLTQTNITTFLLNNQRQNLPIYVDIGNNNQDTESLESLVSAAAWVSGDGILVIIAYQGDKDLVSGGESPGIYVQLPKEVKDMEVLHGFNGWKVTGGTTSGGNVLSTRGLGVGHGSIIRARLS
ncbi:hypothetical protein P280DRAFT_476551 [Massarina eburnea CBS 473.64]|uniref:Uncharacterized protein n=1 Tax=Massarina eburnea CBS 473.64 TaxID=1395130 RepID=A0A6A6S9U2_9PLEO|nr:hypothetical protein P280DRAFT_476551 [Massarina eburnea CBS 473.64]